MDNLRGRMDVLCSWILLLAGFFLLLGESCNAVLKFESARVVCSAILCGASQ
jgi:hypothetical protein